MAVNGISGSTSAGALTNSRSTIADNFDTFLQLLTTQLKNQNPLDPLDTNQFTQQLVQFASVEQQINMNGQLGTLISLQQTAQVNNALNFLGTTVSVSGTTAQLEGGQATWSYAVTKPATATINISNSSGQLVYSTTQTVQPGTQTFSWNGRDTSNNVLPDGSYTMAVTAADASGQTVAVATKVQGTITAVDVSQNPPLVTVNGKNYPLSQITQVLSPSASTSNTQADTNNQLLSQIARALGISL